MTQNAKGPAEAATSPDRGSIETQVGTKMNSTEHSTGPADAPALITTPELQKEFEAIWASLHDLQRKSFILMGRLSGDFDIKRAIEVEGNTVTLMFQKRGIDVTEWLAGEVWKDAANVLEKADSLYDRIEALS